jgi:hypothetical protein
VPGTAVAAGAELAALAFAAAGPADAEAAWGMVLAAEGASEPPPAWTEAAPHPAAINETEARAINRIRMLYRTAKPPLRLRTVTRSVLS